jgi:hypothetical protein
VLGCLVPEAAVPEGLKVIRRQLGTIDALRDPSPDFK